MRSIRKTGTKVAERGKKEQRQEKGGRQLPKRAEENRKNGVKDRRPSRKHTMQKKNGTTRYTYVKANQSSNEKH